MSSTPSTGLFVCAHVYHLLEWLGGACMMFHPTTVFVAQCAIARVSVHSWHFHVLALKLILDCVLRLLTDFLEAGRMQGARTVLQTNMSSRRPSSIERKYCVHTHACTHAQAHILNAVCWLVSITPTQLRPHKDSMSYASPK